MMLHSDKELRQHFFAIWRLQIDKILNGCRFFFLLGCMWSIFYRVYSILRGVGAVQDFRHTNLKWNNGMKIGSVYKLRNSDKNQILELFEHIPASLNRQNSYLYMIGSASEVQLGVNVKLGDNVKNGLSISLQVFCRQRPLHEGLMSFSMT